MRQNQRVQDAITHRYRCVSIGMLLRYHRLRHRTNGAPAPASPRIGDTSRTAPSLLEPDHSVSIEEFRFGSFFIRILRFGIVFRVPFVRRKLAPAVPMQQIVGRSERRGSTQSLIQRLLDFTDDQDTTASRIFEIRRKKNDLVFERHIFSSATASLCFRL